MGVVCVALLVSAAPLVLAQQGGGGGYKIHEELYDSHVDRQNGVPVRLITVRFSITHEGKDAEDLGGDYKVILYELGREVARVDLPRATSEDLSVILAVDISTSMAKGKRMEQTREAARTFFQTLPGGADAGLILFDHEMKLKQPLTRDRARLFEDILKARPGGGTAYLDATVEGVNMLHGVKGRAKKVVVMTDGVDLNSKATLGEAVRRAKAAGVKVYTVGIGEPGRQEKVTSVLVLDHSGSMLEPADDTDKIPKIEALKDAANRFLSFVRETNPPIVRSTVLPFSDVPQMPGPFTNAKVTLRREISQLQATGETALFDATYEAVMALEAERPPGKRAVVALTDGIDNSSRRRVDEVIARAKEAKVPLYMLGFGRKGELDEKVMQRMASETGGEYYHATNQKALMEIFENLSLRLHDDGVDEAALTELAHKTGGEYYPAKDVARLPLVMEKVSQSIRQKAYQVTFRSLVQEDPGLGIDHELKLYRVTSGQVVGGSASPDGLEEVAIHKGREVRHGLVVPAVNQFVYLGLLGVLGLLLALPAGLRRLTRPER
jgi:VWFA-related protein